MSNNFLTSACSTSDTFILTITPTSISEISTIPESFKIARRTDEGIYTVELIPKDKSISSLAFLIQSTFNIITVSPFRILDARYIAPKGIKTPIPNTICNKTINKSLYIRESYYEISIMIRETIRNYVTEGDEYRIKVGVATDGLFVGEVTITRTKSPLFTFA